MKGYFNTTSPFNAYTVDLVVDDMLACLLGVDCKSRMNCNEKSLSIFMCFVGFVAHALTLYFVTAHDVLVDGRGGYGIIHAFGNGLQPRGILQFAHVQKFIFTGFLRGGGGLRRTC